MLFIKSSTVTQIRPLLLRATSTFSSIAPRALGKEHVSNENCYIVPFRYMKYINSQPCSAYSTVSSLQEINLEKYVSPGNEINFSDHSIVFKHKSTWELLRALIILHICGFDLLVKHSYRILKFGEKVLGSKILGMFVSPFYWQFVAGDSEAEMAKAASKLQKLNINLMIAPMIETDVGEGYDMDSKYDENMLKTIHLINVAGRQGNQKLPSICQTKHTAHLPADVLARISKVYESMSQTVRLNAVKELSKAFWDFGNKRNYEISKEYINIDESDYILLHSAIPRFYKIGKQALDMDVVLAVDAEYTYTNPAITLITLAMMDNFNKTRPVVWNTYQALLKSTSGWLQSDLQIAEELNFKFGAKIVRGAYLDKERELSKMKNYPDPTNSTYEATSINYDSIVEYMFQKLSASPSNYNLMVASHNENSIRKAIDLLENFDTNENFVFGQIYGMAENISVPLATAGYTVYKSIPYGNMDEVLPYLTRRASENRAVFKGVRRERNLLTQQLMARMKIA